MAIRRIRSGPGAPANIASAGHTSDLRFGITEAPGNSLKEASAAQVNALMGSLQCVLKEV